MIRGQAAMEYLMTYGWALLAIVVVIGLLIYLNPFSVSSHCIGEAGLDCSNPLPAIKWDGATSTGKLVFVAKSGLSSKIFVLKASCTQSSDPSTATYVDFSVPKTVPVGGELRIVETDGVSCDGAGQGQDYQGYVYLKYRGEKDDPSVTRTLTAKFKTKVE